MMFSFTKVCTTAAIVALAGSTVAVPYASYIRVEETDLTPGTGTNITYNLNEPADSVIIELLDENNIVAGSFAGTTDRGPNSVAWDGTIDNSGGAQLPADTYRVRITADKNNAPWADIASNRSTALLGPEPTVYSSIFEGYAPNDFLFVEDTDSDFFGKAYSNSSSRTSGHPTPVVTVFRSDLEVFDETNGYDSSILHGQELAGANTIAAEGSLWGGAIDPQDTTRIFFVGQMAPRFWRGDLSDDAVLVDAAPPEYYPLSWWSRGIVIRYEGETRMGYSASRQGIYKVPLDSDGNLAAPVEQILDIGLDHYPLRIDVDADNNLYFVSKQWGSSGLNGRLLRWDAATVDSATAAAPLTYDNASWHISMDNNLVRYMLGLAISPDGEVYTMFYHSPINFSYENGIYYVGNSATPTLQKTLAASDKIVDLRDVNGTAWVMNSTYPGIRCDPAGNIILFDRTQQQLRMWTPGGPSSHAVTAPPSQTITMGTGVADWGMY